MIDCQPKFAPKREGPFTIVKVLSLITYQLHLSKTWKIHHMFHTSLLTPYTENEVHGQNFPALLPNLIEGEEEYKIKKILCHHGTTSTHMFLIQWKGYLAKEDSWIAKWELKHAKSTLKDYKKLHPSIFSPQPPSSTHKPSCWTSWALLPWQTQLLWPPTPHPLILFHPTLPPPGGPPTSSSPQNMLKSGSQSTLHHLAVLLFLLCLPCLFLLL